MTTEPFEMPARVAALPRDEAGRPVPWFVATVDGKPDFRIIKPGAINEAVRRNICWVCGKLRFGRTSQSFVIGPMCAGFDRNGHAVAE